VSGRVDRDEIVRNRRYRNAVVGIASGAELGHERDGQRPPATASCRIVLCDLLVIRVDAFALAELSELPKRTAPSNVEARLIGRPALRIGGVVLRRGQLRSR